jgi:histidinol-phosphate aminotransferase
MAAAAALDDKSFVQKSLKMVSEERQKLTAALQNSGFAVLPSGANFVCAKFGPRAAGIVANLESKGIIIRHLKSFGMPEWVRVTVGTPEQNECFRQCLRQQTP